MHWLILQLEEESYTDIRKNVLQRTIQINYSCFIKTTRPVYICRFLLHSLILFKISGSVGKRDEGYSGIRSSYITFNFRMKFPEAENSPYFACSFLNVSMDCKSS